MLCNQSVCDERPSPAFGLERCDGLAVWNAKASSAVNDSDRGTHRAEEWLISISCKLYCLSVLAILLLAPLDDDVPDVLVGGALWQSSLVLVNVADVKDHEGKGGVLPNRL